MFHMSFDIWYFWYIRHGDTWAIRCCKNIPSYCDKWALIPRQSSSCKTSNNAELCPASPVTRPQHFCEDHFRIVVTRSEKSRVHTSAGCADHLLISRVWRPPDTRGAGHTDVKIPGNHNTQHNLHWSRVTGWMDWLLFIAATVNTFLEPRVTSPLTHSVFTVQKHVATQPAED